MVLIYTSLEYNDWDLISSQEPSHNHNMQAVQDFMHHPG